MNTPFNSVLNWRHWSDKITLSGQPSDAHLRSFAEQGITHIINLGPHSNDDALPDEAKSVADAGMHYIYIRVEFDSPTLENFQVFGTALSALSDSKVHVHCIYNARVSAFMYKRAKMTNTPFDTAFQIMDGIWRPGKVWAELIGVPATANGKNQYAGYHY